MNSLKKILYVEDDEDISTIVMMIFEMSSYEVEACSSGKMALEKAPQFMPDLIILDVMMPGMDGVATLAKLRELTAIADAPVIFTTAKVQEDELKEYKALKAAGVIQKPFDPTTFIKQVENLYYQAQQHNGASQFEPVDFKQELQALKQAYIKDLPARVQEIYDWLAVADETKIQAALLALHNLSGSAKIYGIAELADLAHQLENIIKNSRDYKALFLQHQAILQQMLAISVNANK